MYLVILSWIDRSLGETEYLAEIDGYNGRSTFHGPAVAGSGESSSGSAAATVGYRFCITLFAISDSDRSPGSGLCATVRADGSLDMG